MSNWLTPEAIELAKKARKELSKKEPSESWFIKEIPELVKLINKPVGTNFHLHMNVIREKKENQESLEQIVGFEIELMGENQVHWLQYLNKKK